MKEKRKIIQKVIVIFFWLCVWQLLAVWTHNPVLLVGPLQVVKALFTNIIEPDFLKIVLYSLCRIGCGFFLAFLAGFFLGMCSYRYSFLGLFLSPIMTLFTSVPVASFTVLLLIWAGSSGLSFFISFLIVLPNVYVNTIAGFRSVDKKLLEMAEIFHMKHWNRFLCLYAPALFPYLRSCLKISLGMSWKSGVAAEVIGMPRYSLGERLYMSKIYLDTAGLFAWTLVIVLLSFAFEKAVLFLFQKLEDWKPYPALSGMAEKKARQQHLESGGAVLVDNVSKTYGEKQVLSNFSLTLEPGGRYCLMAPSGGGKTTLLRLLGGMEPADGGEIRGMPERIGMVFQEESLMEERDVISNLLAVAGSEKTKTEKIEAGRTKRRQYRKKTQEIGRIRTEAAEILPEECLDKPVRGLSGGMKRRCAVLRAMLSGASFFMMDEPFAGLDEASRRRTAAYILKKLEGRTLLITTHRAEDAALLDALRIDLQKEFPGKKC
ncbi:MAG: ATP-binding cassette domain-containing protein [Blautia sp.]|nr:ATP-binding cassette domain-containing protein [Lachnoclostridium sp.]MCM1211219.1 ATP-binding cassette domain-containing protein [Blautia sp.]